MPIPSPSTRTSWHSAVSISLSPNPLSPRTPHPADARRLTNLHHAIPNVSPNATARRLTDASDSDNVQGNLTTSSVNGSERQHVGPLLQLTPLIIPNTHSSTTQIDEQTAKEKDVEAWKYIDDFIDDVSETDTVVIPSLPKTHSSVPSPPVTHLQDRVGSPASTASSPGAFDAIGRIAMASPSLSSNSSKRMESVPQEAAMREKTLDSYASGTSDSRLRQSQDQGQAVPVPTTTPVPQPGTDSFSIQPRTFANHVDNQTSCTRPPRPSSVWTSSSSKKSFSYDEDLAAHLAMSANSPSLQNSLVKVQPRPQVESAKSKPFRRRIGLDKPLETSHSIPLLHRIAEAALLLLPLLAAVYLLGSAIIPYEWWRTRLSIARIKLGESSASDQSDANDLVDIGLFGVWGWCVMSTESM